MRDEDEYSTEGTHSMSVASRRRRLDARGPHTHVRLGSTLATLLATVLLVACAEDSRRPGRRNESPDAAPAADAGSTASDASVDASARPDATMKADVDEPVDATSADAAPLDAGGDAGAAASSVLPCEGLLASLAVNADGTVVALGYMPNSLPLANAGAVAVYRRGGAGWTREAVLTPPDVREADWFGHSVSLDARGETLAVGSSGVDGTYTNEGRVHVYRAGATGWSEEARLVSFNPGNDLWFGRTVALSRDGLHLAVASLDSSVQVFGYSAGRWTRPLVALRSGLGAPDAFGASLAWAETGALFVGAPLRNVVVVFAGPQSARPSQMIEADRRTLPESR
jgi:hypothetical protein